LYKETLSVDSSSGLKACLLNKFANLFAFGSQATVVFRVVCHGGQFVFVKPHVFTILL